MATAKLNVAVCVIVKDEEKYISEFINHYIKIGFSKVIVCDNNDNEGLKSLLSDFIADGKVIYEDYCFRRNYQIRCYEEMYEKYKSHFDWIAFFDCDEFLTLIDKRTISAFLKQPKFTDCNMICVSWRLHGDNGLVYYDDRDVKERFPEYAPKEYTQNNHVKTIIRCIDDSIVMTSAHSAHFVDGSTYTTNCLGDYVSSDCVFQSVVWEGAVLEHYFTKTISEYIERRFDKPRANGSKDDIDDFIIRFFEINEHTEEKDNIISKYIEAREAAKREEEKKVEHKHVDVAKSIENSPIKKLFAVPPKIAVERPIDKNAQNKAAFRNKLPKRRKKLQFYK